jgi:hypothetical protein
MCGIARGRFTINDFPGARVGGNYKNNNRGQVVGNYSVEHRIVTQHAAELGDLVGRRCAGRHPGQVQLSGGLADRLPVVRISSTTSALSSGGKNRVASLRWGN